MQESCTLSLCGTRSSTKASSSRKGRGDDQHGIHAKHPDDFILDADGIYDGVLINAARRDLEHYIDPALSVDEYIEGLRKASVPNTADYLQRLRVLLTT